MPSKGVLDRQRTGRGVTHTVRANARELGERLKTSLTPILTKGETLPDFSELLLLLARLLEDRSKHLGNTDATHLAEKNDDHAPRKRREAACVALREQISAIRDAARVVFGPDATATGQVLEDPVPTDPVALLRYATRVVKGLQKWDSPAPAVGLFASQTLELPRAAEDLNSQIERLERALGDVGREKRELEAAQHLKAGSVQAFDRTLRGVAHTVKGLCVLVGRPELVAKLRLTPPRRRARQRRKGL